MKERCAWEGCRNPAVKRSTWCATHLWRRRMQRPMEAPIRPRGTNPKQRLQEAALAFADAEDGEKAWHRLRVAAMRWLKANGWHPSKSRKRTPPYVND